jgi:hypothetical protein
MRKALFKLSIVDVAVLSAALSVGCSDYENPLQNTRVPTVVVTPGEVERLVGETQQFSARVTGGNSATDLVDWGIEHAPWDGGLGRSANAVVSVDRATGLATCLKAGVSGIYAQYRGNNNAVGHARLTCTAPEPLQLLNVMPGTVEIDVDRNATNVHVCAFRLESSGGAVTFTLKSDHPSLAAAVSSGSIPAGSFVIVSVFYKGGAIAPFSTTLRFVATSPQGTQEVQVPVKIGFKQ